MDFELSEEQTLIKDTAARFLAEHWSSDKRREALDEPPATIDDALWNDIAAMGWVGMSVTEDMGGLAQDVLTAAILVEQSGAALLPGPLISTLVSAVALDRGGSESLRRAQLPGLIEGRRRATLAVEEANGGWGPDLVEISASSNGDGGGSLSGTKILVPDGERADLFLVAARLPEGLGLIALAADASGLTVTPMRRLDGQSVVELQLDAVQFDAQSVLRGPDDDPETVLRETYDFWTVLLAADLLGVSAAVLEMTTEYAKERVQFGRPIGSFQAVSHRLADNVVALEIGRSLLYGACLALDEQRPDRAALVSAAKAWMSDTAVTVAESGLQLHGGIGYTWELDIHLYLRQARANAASLGDAAYHRERAAAYLTRIYDEAQL